MMAADDGETGLGYACTALEPNAEPPIGRRGSGAWPSSTGGDACVWGTEASTVPCTGLKAMAERVRPCWPADVSTESPQARRERLLGMLVELMTGARESARQMEGEPPDEFTVHAVITGLRRARELVGVLGVAPAVMVVDEMHDAIRRQRGRAQPLAPEFVKLFSRASMQLPIVIEGVFAGTTDGIDPLLPMINALRAQRGAEKLSREGLSGAGQEVAESGADAELRRSLVEAARAFDLGMRAWQEGRASAEDLQRTAELVDMLHAQAPHESAQRMYALAAGLLAAVADRAFVCGPALRASIRDVHGEIVRWAAQGAAAFERGSHDALARKLGYFATVAPTDHPRVVALRGSMGIAESDHGALHAADLRARDVQHPAAAHHHDDAAGHPHAGQADRRTSYQQTAQAMRRELNELQLMTLNHLERFGWELKFVRHRGASIIPVVFDGGRATYGVLQDDGELNEKPDFEIRV